MAPSIDYFHSSGIGKVKVPTCGILPPLVSTHKQLNFSPLHVQVRISIPVNADLFSSGGEGYNKNKEQIRYSGLFPGALPEDYIFQLRAP